MGENRMQRQSSTKVIGTAQRVLVNTPILSAPTSSPSVQHFADSIRETIRGTVANLFHQSRLLTMQGVKV